MKHLVSAQLRVMIGTAAVVITSSVLLGACAAEQPRAAAVSGFELTDQRGQVMSLDDLHGRVILLTFLYTHCPDTCPLYLFKLSQALSDGLDASTSVVVVTVDPMRDTIEHLRGYAGSWPDNWHFLTGQPLKVARVWNAYGVYVEREETATSHSHSLGYGVIHTAKVIVLDEEGRIATELRGDWNAESLRHVVSDLLEGKRPDPGEGLIGPFSRLLKRCGEFASSQPAAFAGLIFLIMLPGFVLPAYMLRTFIFRGKNG